MGETMRWALTLSFLFPLGLLGRAARAEEEAPPPVIPREVLFGNPDRAAVRLSPDGSALSFLAPLDGVMNVWVGPRDDPASARAVTADRGRGIQQYSWAYDSRHLLYLQDRDGDENWHVHAVDLVTGAARDLTPLEGVQARIEGTSPAFPHEILVGLNDRVPALHDLHRIDIRTGERTLLLENPGFVAFVTDDAFRVRLAARLRPDGGSDFLRRTGEAGSEEGWEPFLSVSMEDVLTTSPRLFDASGQSLYLVDSRGRDTAALVRMDMASGEQTVLHEDPRADASDVLVHPAERRVQAVAVNHARKEWTVLDPAIAADLERLRDLDRGDVEVTARSLDDRWWMVAYIQDAGPVRYHLYDRENASARFLFTNRSDLAGLALARMHPVVIPARDGLPLVSYLSLPPWRETGGEGSGGGGADGGASARPDAPLPLVLLVHGGPWARDAWGYNPLHQWLANRGYAVLSVNFRGSTGFGKRFLNASTREWGGRMHDDLLDAVDWAVAAKIADPARVAIAGGSYGGYAALVGLTMTPERFACGVSMVGPSSLLTLLASVPPYWKPMLDVFRTRVGDPRTEEGRALLTERSPLTHVERIQRPLLIGQGANDPRVKRAESEQIVAAMRAKDIPVTYVLYPDEGHGFVRPANRISFWAVTEGFLAPILGGRHEPIGGALEGSSIEVPAGADRVPGLAEALTGASARPPSARTPGDR